MPTDLSGKIFGSYKLVTQLGRGGMATVYRGYQEAIDRSVAVKVLAPELLHDGNFTRRFLAEARTLGQLTHASILPLYDFGTADDMPYIVMPLMPNGTLGARLGQGPLALAEVVRVLTPIAAALDYGHGQGVLHRDVKPSNILFDQHDAPLLADFGIAKALEDPTGLTTTGVLGTPDYMSPEQARGEPLVGQSDQYSLGVVVYQCLTDTPLFKSTTPLGVMYKHASEPAPRLRALRPDLPQAVEAVVQRSLAKNPKERYQSVSEFIAALGEDAAVSEPPSQRWSRVTGLLLVFVTTALSMYYGQWTFIFAPSFYEVKIGWLNFGSHHLFAIPFGLIVGYLTLGSWPRASALSLIGVVVYWIAYNLTYELHELWLNDLPGQGYMAFGVGGAVGAGLLVLAVAAFRPAFLRCVSWGVATGIAGGLVFEFAAYTMSDMYDPRDQFLIGFIAWQSLVGLVLTEATLKDMSVADARATWRVLRYAAVCIFVVAASGWGVKRWASQTMATPFTALTATPMATPTTGPTATPVPYLLYDDFSDLNSGWYQGTSESGSVHYKSGQMIISLYKKYMVERTYASRNFSDVMITTKVDSSGVASDTTFGLACAYSNIDNTYLAGINSLGYYGIWQVRGGNWSVLSGGYSPLIAISAASYQLHLQCFDNILILVVDGRKIASVFDATFSLGGVGLFAKTGEASRSEVRFDDFRVYR